MYNASAFRNLPSAKRSQLGYLLHSSAHNRVESHGIIQPANILANPKIAKPLRACTQCRETRYSRSNMAERNIATPSFLLYVLAYFFRSYFLIFFSFSFFIDATSNEGKTKKTYTLVEKRASSPAIEKQIAPAGVITINCFPYDNYRYSWNGTRRESVFLRPLLTYGSIFFDPFSPLAQMAALNIRSNTASAHRPGYGSPLLVRSPNKFIN